MQPSSADNHNDRDLEEKEISNKKKLYENTDVNDIKTKVMSGNCMKLINNNDINKHNRNNETELNERAKEEEEELKDLKDYVIDLNNKNHHDKQNNLWNR